MIPALPASPALFLDLDGTLLDLAPTPAEVVVPPDLCDVLRRLRAKFADAVAVVTGRPVDQIDALLGDAPFAVAGEHGGAIRHAPGAKLVRAALAELPEHFLPAAANVAAQFPGALLEAKPRGFVLHYRLAPAAGPALHVAAQAIIASESHRFTILPAHMAWEIKPRGADKATAVEALMQAAPFVGRVPVYVGDDTTDEDGMRAARGFGGLGLRVQEVFETPDGVRSWLAQLAAQDNSPAQRAT